MKTLEIEMVSISLPKENLDNPRTINKKKFSELVQSIQELPEMLSLRPLILDEDMIIIGGNMRHKACIHLGFKTVPTIKYTREYHLTTKAYLIFKKTYEEVRDEFIIKDNVGSGQWDWDVLANSWQSNKLNAWGLGVWENKEEEVKEFKPVMFPTQSATQITETDIEKAQGKMGDSFQKGTERKFIETMCPECGHEFNVEKE